MTVKCYNNGYETYLKDEQWVYSDTDEPVDSTTRACKHCKSAKGHPDEPDHCIGMLPGVAFACCGHGEPEAAYIQFENGVVVRGFEVCESLAPCELPLWVIRKPKDPVES